MKFLVVPTAALIAVAPHSVSATGRVDFTPASTVLTINGTRFAPDVPGPMDEELGAVLCRSPNTCTVVDYPAGVGSGSVYAGVAALRSALAESDGPTVVFAYSQGAMVASRWMAEYAGSPDAPSADDLTFVLIGNPTRIHGGGMSLTDPMPDTQYHVIDIARQYDPVADFPDDPANLVALANAAAGFVFVHLDYNGVNVDDPGNFTWTEGNTTYVFVPTEELPLLEPLRLLGMNQLADELNGPLKEVVEAAYDRDLPVDQTAAERVSGASSAAAGRSQDTVPKPAATDVVVGESRTGDKVVRRPQRQSAWGGRTGRPSGSLRAERTVIDGHRGSVRRSTESPVHAPSLPGAGRKTAGDKSSPTDLRPARGDVGTVGRRVTPTAIKR